MIRSRSIHMRIRLTVTKQVVEVLNDRSRREGRMRLKHFMCGSRRSRMIGRIRWQWSRVLTGMGCWTGQISMLMRMKRAAWEPSHRRRGRRCSSWIEVEAFSVWSQLKRRTLRHVRRMRWRPKWAAMCLRERILSIRRWQLVNGQRATTETNAHERRRVNNRYVPSFTTSKMLENHTYQSESRSLRTMSCQYPKRLYRMMPSQLQAAS